MALANPSALSLSGQADRHCSLTSALPPSHEASCSAGLPVLSMSRLSPEAHLLPRQDLAVLNARPGAAPAAHL